MRITVPYAFPTEVRSRRGGGTRRYFFLREGNFDVPEYDSGDAPVSLEHAPFLRGRDATVRVGFRRIGPAVYEPSETERKDDPVEAIVKSLPGCIWLQWPRTTDIRIVGEGTSVTPDLSRERDAVKAVDEAMAGLAFVDGVLHLRTAEPVLVVNDEGVTTMANRPFWDGGSPSRRFRLDEANLVVERLAMDGKDPAVAERALRSFRVVDPSLLVTDLTVAALKASVRTATDALASHLHSRPRASVEAFLALRGLETNRGEWDEATGDRAVAHLDATLGAFDAGLDDSAAKREVEAALKTYASRRASAREHEAEESASKGRRP